ncbi:AbrB/MazE/SpoVT family DNA-binding domain-containing protein [Sphingobium ummariense]
MDIHKVKLIDGQIALAADVRRKLDLHIGDTVLFDVREGEVRIRSARSMLRKIQAQLQGCPPGGGLDSEALSIEHRAKGKPE